MAGLPVVYPDTLPHPEVGQFTPRERRAINREFMRPISRDRAGTRSVAFTYTPAQAREFREWYQEWVTMGGGMFAAPWPMPWGRGPHVFRFVEPPTWQLIGGGIDGQGYWRVTADVELRGRGEMPTLDVLVVTSKPYPYEFSDSLETSSPLFYDVPHPFWSDSLGTSAPAFIAGSLRDPLVEYEGLPESLETSAPVFIAGELKAPLVSYEGLPEALETSAPEFIAGTLKVAIITYSNWPLLAEDDESLETSAPTFISGTLS